MENQNRSNKNKKSDDGAPVRRGRALPKPPTGKNAPRRGNRPGESNSRSERVRLSAEKRKRKKRRRDAFLVFILIVMLGALATVLSTTVFFKAEEILIDNQSGRYSEEQIAAASGLSTGDNMLTAKLDKAAESIRKDLPYIRIANVRRKWPNAFLINVSYADTVLAVQKGGAFIYIDVDGKVLETDVAQPDASAAIVTGAFADSAVPGSPVELTDEKTLNSLLQIVSVLYENGITKITAVNVSNPTDIIVELDHRIEVKLGASSNAAEKIAFGKAVIDKNMSGSSTKKLIIDLTTDAKAFVREKEQPTQPVPEETKTPTDAEPEDGDVDLDEDEDDWDYGYDYDEDDYDDGYDYDYDYDYDYVEDDYYDE